MPSADTMPLMLEDESMRDGLQMESRIFSLEEKIKCFQLLEQAGIPRIQVGSFVHPKIIPQMADTDRLVRRLVNNSSTATISALILNGKGLDRAIACGVPHINMSVSVSDTHSRKNAGKTAQQALTGMIRLIDQALARDIEVRAGLQCVFGCIYEGAMDLESILTAAEHMIAAGITEIYLADSTGMATPVAIRDMVQAFNNEFPDTLVSLHLHDTRGMGMANLFAGYEAGVRSFDVCAGGLGGCPFIKGAAGNVAAEDAVNMFETMGVDTGVNLEGLCKAVEFYEACLGRRLPGRMTQVLAFNPACG